MAELVALGLAANIVQFLGHGFKFIGVAMRVYRNSEEGLDCAPELYAIASNIRDLTKELERPKGRDVVFVAQAQNMVILARECNRVARELLGVLDKLKLPPASRGRGTY